MDEPTRRVRHHIFSFYLDKCRPPTIEEIIKETELDGNEVRNALQQLDDTHHIVLHKPGVHSPTPISMAHPFSHLPTPFIIKQGERSWWANCAWCGFGLAAMLLPSEIPVTVSVRSGSIGKELVFEVSDAGIHLQGGGQTGKCVVHYSAPPSSWWIDVKFACGTIHVFEDKDEAATWCDRYGFNVGETMNMDIMWKLAKAWYSEKASYGYNRPTEAEKSHLFEELGMVSEFWTE